jgi:hypothetical protein
LRNQRLWDIIKAVLRLLCVALSVIIVGEIIALGVGSPGLFDAGWVVYPLVSLRPGFHHFAPYGRLQKIPILDSRPSYRANRCV